MSAAPNIPAPVEAILASLGALSRRGAPPNVVLDARQQIMGGGARAARPHIPVELLRSVYRVASAPISDTSAQRLLPTVASSVAAQIRAHFAAVAAAVEEPPVEAVEEVALDHLSTEEPPPETATLIDGQEVTIRKPSPAEAFESLEAEVHHSRQSIKGLRDDVAELRLLVERLLTSLGVPVPTYNPPPTLSEPIEEVAVETPKPPRVRKNAKQ